VCFTTTRGRKDSRPPKSQQQEVDRLEVNPRITAKVVGFSLQTRRRHPARCLEILRLVQFNDRLEEALTTATDPGWVDSVSTVIMKLMRTLVRFRNAAEKEVKILSKALDWRGEVGGLDQ